ncbi:MAG: hypothetical protein GY696_01170 [Gammaproteobacteria bacterium]|nr:hypothetical protein [Gammaproteobacteria bacterium]
MFHDDIFCVILLIQQEHPVRYFERSEDSSAPVFGRQDTVIYREADDVTTQPPVVIVHAVGHAASDSNITDLEGDRQLLRQLKKSDVERGRLAARSSSAGKSLRGEDGTCDWPTGSSLEDSTSLLNYSADSVFTSQEILEECGTSGLVSHLLTLQGNNTVLIRRLRDKTHEYEQITDQLEALEREVRVLKGKYKFEEITEKIEAEKSEKLIPKWMFSDMEGKLKEMDENLRSFKNDSFRTQVGFRC